MTNNLNYIHDEAEGWLTSTANKEMPYTAALKVTPISYSPEYMTLCDNYSKYSMPQMMPQGDPMDLPISTGKGNDIYTMCLQQKASLVHAWEWGYLTPELLRSVLTDRPCWQNEIVNQVGITLNDAIDCDDSHTWSKLNLMVPRIVRATVVQWESEERVNKRLAVWAMRWTLDLVDRPGFPFDQVGELIDKIEAGPCGAAEAAAMEGDAGIGYKAKPLEIATGMPLVSASRGHYVDAVRLLSHWLGVPVDTRLWLGVPVDTRLTFFDRLLDVHAKAVADEGLVFDDQWIKVISNTLNATPTHEPKTLNG